MGGATVLVAGTGVLSYRVFDNGVLDSGSGRACDPWSSWRQDATPLGAVGVAILAADPHNTQPWLFHVSGTGVEVFADPIRGMPAVDPFNRAHNPESAHPTGGALVLCGYAALTLLVAWCTLRRRDA